MTINGDKWFCAMDAAKAFGMASHTKLFSDYGIKDSERRTVLKSSAKFTSGEISFPNRGLTFVNATAVRRIAQRSTKPAAREFQDFLNGTVAEVIRKGGHPPRHST